MAVQQERYIITHQDIERNRQIATVKDEFHQALGGIPDYYRSRYHYMDGTSRVFRGRNGSYGVYESDDNSILIVSRTDTPIEEKVHIQAWRGKFTLSYLLANGTKVEVFRVNDSGAFSGARGLLQSLKDVNVR